ncbi:Cut8 six-helix bundle-domain-containing protein [Gorgonomyces haynaldii]|nr:Cut8 six-helix bundle-domain-containing protein [Gorgonomyces haynaldii]
MSLETRTPPSRKRKTFEEYYETPKRIRWQLTKETPSPTPAASQSLGDVLQTLEKQQLIDIINALVNAEPQLQGHIATLLPRPTLKHVQQLLLNLEKQLMESFPYSKFGPDRSEYSYNRVRPHFMELRNSIFQYLDFFCLLSSYPPNVQHEYAGDSFAYLHTCTLITHRLPIWENHQHNQEQSHPIYEKLGKYWRHTISETAKSVRDGKFYGSTIVGEWAHNLALHCNELQGKYGFQEAWDEFRKAFGWMLGLENTPVFGMSTGTQPGQVYSFGFQ